MTGDQLVRVYGPTIALLLTLALLVILLPTDGGEAGLGSGFSTPDSPAGPGAGTGDGPAPVADGSATDAPAGGTAEAVATEGGAAPTTPGGTSSGATGSGEGAGAATGQTTADGRARVVASGSDCRPDGRTVGISVWQPPCIEWKKGTDNGGATARGVTRDKVKVVFYTTELNTAAFAVGTAAGIQQSKEQIETYTKLWLNYFNDHTQTYGREVEFKYIEGGTDEAASRAAARRAAVEENAFALIGACCSRAQFQEGGAHDLVMVSSPGQPLANDLAQNPYAITRAPAVEWVFEDSGYYLCQRLAGRKAKWAADPVIQQTQRKFGLLYSEGTTASGAGNGPAVRVLERAFAECGGRFAEKIGVTSDQSSWGNQAQNAIAKLKAAEVTTVVFYAPILSQVFMTQAADQQSYFPEWYVGGTCCNDAVIVNRAASPAQTPQFFGTSNQFFWWRDDASTFEAVREAVVGNEGRPLPNVGSSGSATNNAALTATIWWPLMQGFFGCLQLAGPTLTPETWRQGCDRYGQAGGFIQNYPYALRFFTPDRPFMIQDQAEWWWEPNATCNDEANRTGRGCTMWVAAGRRTGFKQWPGTEPDLFNPANASLQPNQPVVWTDPDGHEHGRCLSCS